MNETERVRIYVLVLSFVSLLFLYKGYLLVMGLMVERDMMNSYPLLLSEKTSLKYHTTDEILDQVYFGNDGNPFYTSYTIASPYENDEQRKVYSEIKKYFYISEFSGTDDSDEFRTLMYGPKINLKNTNSDDDDEKNNIEFRIAIICGQHAREFISPEICYNLIKLIQVAERFPEFTERIAKLRSKGVSFWVLPIVNEGSKRFIENDPDKNFCVRRNPMGVDLNRNFECPDFKRQNTKNKEKNLEYPGEYDFSEVETKITEAFLDISNPHVLFNIHSGAEKILLPYDCSETKVPKNYGLMARTASLARKEVIGKYKDFPLVRPKRWQIGKSSLFLYVSHGTLSDYAEYSKSIPIVYTLEVYESLQVNESVPENDMTPEQCRDWFNPREGQEYRQTIIVWIDQILTTIEKLHPRIKK